VVEYNIGRYEEGVVTRLMSNYDNVVMFAVELLLVSEHYVCLPARTRTDLYSRARTLHSVSMFHVVVFFHALLGRCAYGT